MVIITAPPKVLTMDEYQRDWQPQGWQLIIIGPTSTWRQDWGEWEAIRDIVQNALALADCTTEGVDFVGHTRFILGNDENQNHPIISYRQALMNRDTEKIQSLDAALAGGRYSEWVAERITEVSRFLGLEPPRFTVRTGERTPQWDLLWQKIFTGGDEN